MGKNPNKFPKEDTAVGISTSSAMWEMQTQSHRPALTPWEAEIKQTMASVRGGSRSPGTAGGNVKWGSCFGTRAGGSSKGETSSYLMTQQFHSQVCTPQRIENMCPHKKLVHEY